MEYQKIINLLDDAINQPSKFRTTNWVQLNDESRWTYNDNSYIKFKTSIIRSNLCDYSDVYKLKAKFIAKLSKSSTMETFFTKLTLPFSFLQLTVENIKKFNIVHVSCIHTEQIFS